ncbi:MAG: hypothetical protein ACRCSL_12210 [Microbacterium sp.]
MEFAYHFGLKPADILELRLRHYIAFVQQIEQFRAEAREARRG